MLDHFRDTGITYSASDVPLTAQKLFPIQWQSHLRTYHSADVGILSLLQSPSNNTAVVRSKIGK